MRIIFSDHAEHQLKIRKIPKKYVLETIKDPDDKDRTYRGRKLLRKGFGGKILEVVIAVEEGLTTVITQYYLD